MTKHIYTDGLQHIQKLYGDKPRIAPKFTTQNKSKA